MQPLGCAAQAAMAGPGLATTAAGAARCSGPAGFGESVSCSRLPALHDARALPRRVHPMHVQVLQMAGIQDCYTSSRGNTKTQGARRRTPGPIWFAPTALGRPQWGPQLTLSAAVPACTSRCPSASARAGKDEPHIDWMFPYLCPTGHVVAVWQQPCSGEHCPPPALRPLPTGRQLCARHLLRPGQHVRLPVARAMGAAPAARQPHAGAISPGQARSWPCTKGPPLC